MRGVVVAGEAGVGKTTLVRLCTESLSCRVQWVAGTQSTRSIPLGAFADLVAPATPRDPMLLLAAARNAILAQRDCVLCVDDAHLLDLVSATLLHRLAIDGSMRIVATVRSDATTPDAGHLQGPPCLSRSRRAASPWHCCRPLSRSFGKPAASRDRA